MAVIYPNASRQACSPCILLALSPAIFFLLGLQRYAWEFNHRKQFHIVSPPIGSCKLTGKLTGCYVSVLFPFHTDFPSCLFLRVPFYTLLCHTGSFCCYTNCWSCLPFPNKRTLERCPLFLGSPLTGCLMAPNYSSQSGNGFLFLKSS